MTQLWNLTIVFVLCFAVAVAPVSQCTFGGCELLVGQGRNAPRLAVNNKQWPLHQVVPNWLVSFKSTGKQFWWARLNS